MKYWIVIYLYRRVGGDTWSVANERHEGSLSDWFRQQAEFESQDIKLLNAIEIPKREYDNLEHLD